MREVGQQYESLLTRYLPTTQPRCLVCPIFSTVMGEVLLDASSINARYWRHNLESPVLFATAVQRLLASRDSKGPTPVFIEIGPHPALSGPLREIFLYHAGNDAPIYLPTLDRKSNDSAVQLHETAAECFSLGINVDLLKINGHGHTLTDLPVYPWDHHERHWHESRIAKDRRFRSFPNHELLGSRVTGSTDFDPTWRNLLSLDSVPWLFDHRLQGEIVFPGAAYVCMAGEAVQQLIAGSNSFSTRHVVFKTPLVLREFEELEIITSLRSVRVNTITDSEWFEFSVAAYDPQSARWVKHSQGQVRAGADMSPIPKKIEKKPRPVPADQWYSILDRSGLSYRGSFQGLRDISADPKELAATATVKDYLDSHASRYLIHPAAIDSCLQLFSVAATSGLSYRFDQLVIPAGIEDIYISKGSDSMEVEALYGTKQSRTAYGDAFMMNDDGEVALAMTKVVMAVHEDSGDLMSGGRLAAEVEWQPWLETFPRQNLFPAVDFDQNYVDQFRILVKMCLLYILETADRIRDVKTDIPALENWKNWILKENSDICSGKKTDCQESAKWALWDSPARLHLIDDLTSTLDHTNGSISIARCLKQNFDSCVYYLKGDSSPMDCLARDDMLRDFYRVDRSFVLWNKFITLLGHQHPTMRILEIGGGTGAATSSLLKVLRSSDGVSLFSSYTFTDISSEFTATAKEQFAGMEKIEFKRLDISKDVQGQGFQLHSFDLIIASNVIHATPNLKYSLERVHDLIAPGGYFMLHELDTEHPFVDYTFGVLPGWWAGKDDGRPERPFISPENWDLALKSAKFTGVESIVHDAMPPDQLCATMISRPVAQDLALRDICLLAETPISAWARDVESRFLKRGFTVSWTTLEQEQRASLQPDAVFISLLDMNRPLFHSLTEETFHHLQTFLNASEDRSLIWVTPATQMSCLDPRYALTNGFFRALQHEMEMSISIFEVDQFDSTATFALVDICCEIQKSQYEHLKSPDHEFSLQQGIVYVPRTHWRTVDHISLPQVLARCPQKIDIETYGLLDSFKWVPCEPDDLQQGFVEIEVQYAALNFRVRVSPSFDFLKRSNGYNE